MFCNFVEWVCRFFIGSGNGLREENRPPGILRSREELLMCMFGCCMLHTILMPLSVKWEQLRMPQERRCCWKSECTLLKADFLRSVKARDEGPPSIQSHCLVISLFNGIGRGFQML